MEEIYQKISNPDEFGIDTDEKSEIQDFYANQTVFLTGCTGFIGKCVVEKLLRGCPDLKKLYLMVRPNKISAKERIIKYFDDIVFEKLCQLNPHFKSKVEVLEGNLESDNLDLSDKDRNIIINEVTIFFHNASNVKFSTSLSSSLLCNVFGTKKMLELAKECKHIKIFVYMSTAYSHCYEKQIFEKPYPPPGDLKMIQDLIDVDQETPGGMSEVAKTEAFAPWPNLYTFGKATAESLVEEFAKTVLFRCTIYRPSIVLSTYKEPIASWTGNVNGPVLAFIGAGLGMFHIGYNCKLTFDIVPADMCTNGLLAITWDAVINRKESRQVLVYNYGSSVVNPIDPVTFETFVVPRGRETPSIKMVGPHYTVTSPYMIIFILGHIIMHGIPALLADIALLVSGRKPKAFAIFIKATSWLPQINFFINGNWRIYMNETEKVWNRMNKKDNDLFYNDLRTLEWENYGYTYWPGLRKYILKDPITTLNRALKKFHLFQRIFHIICIILVFLIIYCFKNYFLLLLVPFHNLVKLLYVVFCKG